MVVIVIKFTPPYLDGLTTLLNICMGDSKYYITIFKFSTFKEITNKFLLRVLLKNYSHFFMGNGNLL
ncbi:MAG TPA: hypothetical protein DCG18_01345 [Richelia sp.]|jgi:hypothetical protein|nr:hypothetical protein [Richelia sp.]